MAAKPQTHEEKERKFAALFNTVPADRDGTGMPVGSTDKARDEALSGLTFDKLAEKAPEYKLPEPPMPEAEHPSLMEEAGELPSKVIAGAARRSPVSEASPFPAPTVRDIMERRAAAPRRCLPGRLLGGGPLTPPDFLTSLQGASAEPLVLDEKHKKFVAIFGQVTDAQATEYGGQAFAPDKDVAFEALPEKHEEPELPDVNVQPERDFLKEDAEERRRTAQPEEKHSEKYDKAHDGFVKIFKAPVSED
ncbi:unnamed protein product [Ostreobium quekettii]|uniref:Uncharacterized protein n=1 Tax=Ostreobium quekettii TaxID=121088 RepID=A0A8S1INS0_9CHLO|nr:unnamed protein product [Ostreobium quekettii]